MKNFIKFWIYSYPKNALISVTNVKIHKVKSIISVSCTYIFLIHFLFDIINLVSNRIPLFLSSYIQPRGFCILHLCLMFSIYFLFTAETFNLYNRGGTKCSCDHLQSTLRDIQKGLQGESVILRVILIAVKKISLIFNKKITETILCCCCLIESRVIVFLFSCTGDQLLSSKKS